MKIAIAGKGGTGKTTVAGTLARLAAARGYQTLALDCDSNPNLGISLGLDFDTLNAIRPLPKTITGSELWSAEYLVSTYGVRAPGEITLVVAARVEEAAAG